MVRVLLRLFAMNEHKPSEEMDPKAHYSKLYIMLGASFVIMYAVMFLNVAESDHIRLSLTRAYMSLLMVTPMALMMILLMPKMLPDKRKNTMIGTGAVLLFVLALILLRTQTPVGDIQYMKAMIPHHSSAILTSERANITDPEVKKLAEEIIEAQVREIREMNAHIRRLEDR